MPKVKEPTPQYSSRNQTQTAELLLREIQGLPTEALTEVIHFIRFLRSKFSGQKKKNTRWTTFPQNYERCRAMKFNIWKKSL
jgi:hypothetical protein